jgi:hypothetical protein
MCSLPSQFVRREVGHVGWVDILHVHVEKAIFHVLAIAPPAFLAMFAAPLSHVHVDQGRSVAEPFLRLGFLFLCS